MRKAHREARWHALGTVALLIISSLVAWRLIEGQSQIMRLERELLVIHHKEKQHDNEIASNTKKVGAALDKVEKVDKKIGQVKGGAYDKDQKIIKAVEHRGGIK